jgi:hypothetical protein
MAIQRTRPSALSGLTLPAIAVLLVALALGGAWGMGLVQFGRPPSNRAPAQPPGTRPVLLSAVPIPAYTRITRDHLWSPQLQRLAAVYLPEAQISSSAVTTLDKLIGRVLNHDKPAGYMFHEDDFFPKGTREGETAGIPPGYIGKLFEASRLPGVHGLKIGDRFDIDAALHVDAGAFNAIPVRGGWSAAYQLQRAMNGQTQQAIVRVIARDAVVVRPVGSRAQPTTSTALIGGTTTRSVQVQEIFIAVKKAELPAVEEALAIGAQIHCLPRSSRPDDDATRVEDHFPKFPLDTPDADPSAQMVNPKLKWVDTWQGNEHTLVVVPDGSEKK